MLLSAAVVCKHYAGNAVVIGRPYMPLVALYASVVISALFLLSSATLYL